MDVVILMMKYCIKLEGTKGRKRETSYFALSRCFIVNTTVEGV